MQISFRESFNSQTVLYSYGRLFQEIFVHINGCEILGLGRFMAGNFALYDVHLWTVKRFKVRERKIFELFSNVMLNYLCYCYTHSKRISL